MRAAQFACLLSAFLLSAGAAAADTPDMAAAKARYEKEKAICMSGQSQQDRATCLREAGAALDESKRNGLRSGDGQLKANARARCEGLPDPDRKDCLSRVEGTGTQVREGSVKGGGVLKETITREVVPASAPAAASAPN